MSRPVLKWGDVARYCGQHGFTIMGSGGDKIIHAPAGNKAARSRNQLRIGHTSSGHGGTPVMHCYYRKLEQFLGCTLQNIVDC